MNIRTIMSALLLMAAGSTSAAVKVGQPAPDFTGIDSNGQQQTLSDYRGKFVVLEWTNHDCPYVRKHYEAGNMQAQQREAADAGVVWLSVISSAPGQQGHIGPGKANELTQSRNAAPRAVVLDPSGDIGRAYSARTTPHMYIVNPDGTLVYQGGIDSITSANSADIPKARQHVRIALNELMSGTPVSQAVTRPYGCSVKY